MDLPLISVIVPVYKVEAYLDRCVASIVNQTYRNLEIILVDDGSPDNCGVMCDAWAERDSRIKVIHKENGGLSDARNAGMAVASGEYIGFVDSDDYIAELMYELLLERMLRDGSDIAACGVEMVFEDGTPSRPLTRSGETLLGKEEALAAVIRESWLKQPVWYKLYKADKIQGLLFPVGKYHEDVYWTWQAVARAEKVSVLDMPCYFYLQRSGSIMGEGYSLKRLDAIEAKALRLEYLKKHHPALAAVAEKDLLFSCLYHGQLALKGLSGGDLTSVMTWLKETADGCDPEGAELSATHRLWSLLAQRNFALCCRLRNCLGIGL